MILFYSNNIQDNLSKLIGDEYIHCCKVLRHKIGDFIHITEGQGTFAEAEISDISKKEATLTIHNRRTVAPKASNITLAVAPPKNRARWEWILEKSVEIGVDHIQPMFTQNSERSKVNIERSLKIMRSAALQSKRNYHPSIAEPCKIDKVLDLVASQQHTGLMCHYNEENPHLTTIGSDSKRYTLLIGPEGDFSQQERLTARSQGIQEVNISHNRLRTETACLVALSYLVNF